MSGRVLTVASVRQAQEEVTVVCTAEQRRAMIVTREQFLLDDARPQPEQKQTELGKPIGATFPKLSTALQKKW